MKGEKLAPPSPSPADVFISMNGGKKGGAARIASYAMRAVR
jgi:hypothetical protein